MDVLKFNEWVENSICISTGLNRQINVFSLQARRSFYKSDVVSLYHGESVLNDLEKGVKSEILYKVYKDNYDWIQAQHQQQLMQQN